MSTAYDRFLVFFNKYDRERLDGLDASYFDAMTDSERQDAYAFMLPSFLAGSEESTKGLYLANADKSLHDFKHQYNNPDVSPEQEILMTALLDKELGFSDQSHIVKYIDSDKASVKAAALNALSIKTLDMGVVGCLHSIILSDVDGYVIIGAARKLIDCHCRFSLHGSSFSLNDKKNCLMLLGSSDLDKKKQGLKWLSANYPLVEPDLIGVDQEYLILGQSGELAPKAGRWTARDLLDASVHVSKGEILPKLNGKETTWIWVEL